MKKCKNKCSKISFQLLLLHHKASPNLQDNEGNTALHLATLHGHEDVSICKETSFKL